MASSPHSIEDVYKEIFTISNYFEADNNGQLTVNEKYVNLFHKYCHYGRNSGDGKCNNYFEMVSSGVIHLLTDLKNKYDLEDDKLAEYGILWLIYKLKQHSGHKLTNLNNFYIDHIVKNKDYDKKINGDDGLTYKEIIDKKKDLMDMNINEIFKLEAPFNILYYLYYVIRVDDFNCTNDSKFANQFADQFKDLNNDSKNIEKSSFNQILSTLSNDYKNIKKIYHGKKSCDLPSIPELTLQKNPVKNSGETLGKTPEITSSSSSILNTVIPGLSTFAIPVFLGVAYKYSLFGIDKLFQRQYIKKKLKKVKKEMEINI